LLRRRAGEPTIGQGRMTEDEIRDTRFPLGFWGYAPGHVSTWLTVIADSVDAGVPPTAFIPEARLPQEPMGCNRRAVDQFLTELGYTQPERPGGHANHGDVLGRFRLGAATGPGTSRRWARQRNAGSLRIADLSGTRIRCPRGMEAGKILSSDGQLLMIRRVKSSRTGEVLEQTWTVVGGVHAFRVAGVKGPVVDVSTGETKMRIIGQHGAGCAAAVVLFADQRWLRFPVDGSSLRNAVMTAVNESGRRVLWFSHIDAEIEVVVSPECELSPELLCVIAMAASWLEQYFPPPDSYGG